VPEAGWRRYTRLQAAGKRERKGVSWLSILPLTGFITTHKKASMKKLREAD